MLGRPRTTASGSSKKMDGGARAGATDTLFKILGNGGGARRQKAARDASREIVDLTASEIWSDLVSTICGGRSTHPKGR